jgi:hypothetical protein
MTTGADEREQDPSWHESTFAKDLTPDGDKTLLIDEGAEGYFHAIYRSADGRIAGQT